MCRVNTTAGQLPTNTSFWDVLAQKGDPGLSSSVTLQSNGVNLPNSPHMILNFLSGFTLADINGNTASISLQSQYGGDYTYAEDLTTSSTSSTTFIQRMQLTTPSVAAGNYRIGWQGTWSFSSISNFFNLRVQQDSTITLHDLVEEPPDTSGTNRYAFCGFARVTLTAGVHTFDIDYRRIGGTGNAFIYESRLEFYRV